MSSSAETGAGFFGPGMARFTISATTMPSAVSSMRLSA